MTLAPRSWSIPFKKPATARLMFFSCKPNRLFTAPGSEPPCPGSRTIIQPCRASGTSGSGSGSVTSACGFVIPPGLRPHSAPPSGSHWLAVPRRQPKGAGRQELLVSRQSPLLFWFDLTVDLFSLLRASFPKALSFFRPFAVSPRSKPHLCSHFCKTPFSENYYLLSGNFLQNPPAKI